MGAYEILAPLGAGGWATRLRAPPGEMRFDARKDVCSKAELSKRPCLAAYTYVAYFAIVMTSGIVLAVVPAPADAVTFNT